MTPKTTPIEPIDVERIVQQIRETVRHRAELVAREDSALHADGDSDFSERDYLSLYPDVAAAVASGSYRSGRDHWLRAGASQGRLKARPGKAPRPDQMPVQTTARGSSGIVAAELLRKVHLATSRIEMQANSIGLPPPGPKNLRGKVGASLMRSIGTLLWWYTHSIHEFAMLTNSRNRDVNKLLKTLAESQARDGETIRLLQNALAEQAQSIAQLKEELRTAGPA